MRISLNHISVQFPVDAPHCRMHDTKSLDGVTVDSHTQLVFAWRRARERYGKGFQLLMSTMSELSEWYLKYPSELNNITAAQVVSDFG